MFIFFWTGNSTGNLPNYKKYVLYSEFISQHRVNFEILIIKKSTRIVAEEICHMLLVEVHS